MRQVNTYVAGVLSQPEVKMQTVILNVHFRTNVNTQITHCQIQFFLREQAWEWYEDLIGYNSLVTRRKISASLSYDTVRGERKMERTRGEQDAFAQSLSFPHRTSAVWPPTCVFVTVNEARRYLATSTQLAEVWYGEVIE
jgi:hypothetical protein